MKNQYFFPENLHFAFCILHFAIFNLQYFFPFFPFAPILLSLCSLRRFPLPPYDLRLAAFLILSAVIGSWNNLMPVAS